MDKPIVPTVNKKPLSPKLVVKINLKSMIEDEAKRRVLKSNKAKGL